MEIVELEHIPSFTDSVIQDDLVPYLPRINFDVVNTDNPLFGLKLHISTQRTIIGIAWHHTLGIPYNMLCYSSLWFNGFCLGDAASLFHFMNILSGYYQNNNPDYSSLPSFRKHLFPKPSQTDILKWLPHMSHLAHTYPASEINAKYTEGNEVIHPIRAIVRRSDAEALRRNVQAMQDSNFQSKISVHDCLAACFITAINSLQTDAVRRFTNVAGVSLNIYFDWIKI